MRPRYFMPMCLAFLLPMIGIAVQTSLGEQVLAPLNSTRDFRTATAQSDELFVNTGGKVVQATSAVKIQGHPDSRIFLESDKGSGNHRVAQVIGREGDCLYHVEGKYVSSDPFATGQGNQSTWWADYNKGDARLSLQINGEGAADDYIVKAANGGTLTIALADGTDKQKYTVALTQQAVTGGSVNFSTNSVDLYGCSDSKSVILTGTNPGKVKLIATSGTLTENITGEVVDLRIKNIYGHPNNELALNNRYLAQDGDVGILVGWKLKFEGGSSITPQAGDVFSWEYKSRAAGGAWANLATGLTATDVTAPQMGDYDVRLKFTRAGNDQFSEERRLMVADVNTVTLTLTNSGDYTRGSNQPMDPEYHDIIPPELCFKANGNIVLKNDSPSPNNIKQGMIQGSVPKIDHSMSALVPPKVNLPAGEVDNPDWKPGSVAGDTADYYAKFGSLVSTSMLNDSFLGHQLYGDSVPMQPGTEFAIYDRPDFPQPFAMKWDRPKAYIYAYYETVRTIVDNDFTIWLVLVVNAAGDEAHYVPYKQQSWKLNIDSTDGNTNTWKCEKVGQPAAPTSQPTDKTTSTQSVVLPKWTNKTVLTK